MERRSKELAKGEMSEASEGIDEGNVREREFVIPGSISESKAQEIMNEIGDAIFSWKPFYLNDNVRVKLTVTYEFEDK